ncbi:MAG: DUF4332 domain-containing protein [Anaerolineae bacterium]|jgi:hypothetical protein
MMAIPIKDLKGMTAGLESDLQMLGIYTDEQLLEATRMPGDRETLAAKLGVEASFILELANRADLSRVCGAAGDDYDLLEQAKLTGRVSPRGLVERWIAEAKDLPRRLEH